MQPLSREVAREKSKWLKALLGEDKIWLKLSVLAGLVAGLMLILQAHLLARAVDATLFHDASIADLTPLLIGVFVALLIRSAMAMLREWGGQKASSGVRTRLRVALLSRLAELGPSYTRNQRAGEISSLVIEQTEALDGFIARYLPQMSLAALLPLVILAFVFPINWVAGLVFLCTAPLIPLAMALVGMKAADANRRNFKALALLSAYFLDVVQGLTTLKLFSKSREQGQIIGKNAEEFRIRTMQVLRLAFLSSAVLEFFASVSIAILAVYLGFSFLGLIDVGTWSGGVTLYHALFILILAPEFYLPLKELGTHYHAKQEAIAAAERLMDLFDELDRAEIGGDQEPPIGAPSIHLSNIGFSYAAHLAPVLQNLDLTLRSGECVALVGPSGVGKSSLLSVLAGFDRPQHGAVLVEGIPLSALKRSSWMKRIALVSQHTTLFPGSIRDNLLMARPEATDSQLEMACEQAALTGFIEQLPKGLDTPVGEAGLGFSGGQIQRLSLARAFLKDAPILLLDEPTASLDAENEQKVLESLRLLCRGRTTLLVTHRPASMAIADRVYRLVDGRCEEINEVNMAKGGV